MKKYLLMAAVFLISAVFSRADNSNDLSEKFKNPDKTYYPWIYWYWLNGNINEAGLMADLEAMDKAGIGTAMAFDVGIGVPGPVTVRSDEWYSLMKKVILKADELGMRIGFNCPGWANAGGPWITPETAMKELTWSECHVSGKGSIVKLPQPPGRLGFYKDIAILAFPSIQDDSFSLTTNHCVVTDTLGNEVPDYTKLFDNDRDTWVHLPGTFQVTFDEPQTVRSMQVRASNIADSRFFVADLWYWDEQSGEYRHIAYIPGSPSGLNDRPGMGTASFSPVKAKKFKLGFKTGYNNTTVWSKEVYLQELDLQGGYRIPCWHNKTGFGHQEFNDFQVVAADADIVDPDEVIDLTEKLAEDGTLDWCVPEGDWTVVRLGYIPTGAMSQPLNRGLNSLECDKFSRDAAKVQYDGVMEPLFDLVGRDVAKRVFSNYHVDSYEVGWQNWSECLPEEFMARRGYDMNKYLLALTGRAVSTVEETNAFLWDFRRTMADCYADNHIGYFTERAEKDGMIFSIEAYDGPFEDLQTAGRANMPMSEIWQKTDPNYRPRSAAMFAAHIYDRKLIGTEQFTGMGIWDLHPWVMKNNVDASLAYGVNNIAMHVYSQQPWTDPKFTPGATLGPWGAHYDRANTWFSLSRPWHDYIARCQVMLREGRHVADYLQFLGDNAPNGGGNLPLNPPFGYEGDALNGEVLMTLSVEDGFIKLPFGKKYRYLVLPEHGRMNLSSLKKIKELVDSGACVLGRRPLSTYSLEDLTRQDEFSRLVKEIFDAGNDNVYENKSIQDVIKADGLKPDFSCIDTKGLNIKFNHRQSEDMDIYFVTNISSDKGATINCSFRVSGMIPEIWDPMTGERSAVAVYKDEDGITTIPIDFCQGASKFVVFSKEGIKSNIAGISYGAQNIIENQSMGSSLFELKTDPETGEVSVLSGKEGNYDVQFKNGKVKTKVLKHVRPDVPIEGPWSVSFETRLLSPIPVTSVQSADGRFTTVEFDSLKDWTESSEEGIKYYSGTASYHKSIILDPLKKNERCVLRMENVNVIAHVYVNGVDAGIYWKPPFDVDITDLVVKGENDLKIEITNLWPNRLIGDEQYPDDVTKSGNWRSGELYEYPEWVWNQADRPEKRRVSFTTFKHYKPEDNLLPSGMTGNVMLSFPVEMKIR